MKLQPSITDITDQVRQIVSPVYLVGGSVRDALLGIEPNDFDFATPLHPDNIESAVHLSGRRPFVTGKRFGTVGFKIDGHLIEVTTFRLESYSQGSRKPQVEFVDDITYDLSRRDFTINAMAIREDGSLIDPFGGWDDLKQRLIRTVNKPFERYHEDPLRMLRAARFAAQLGFRIEEETERQASKKAHVILEVSKERWMQEMDKLLTSDHVEEGLQFLARTRLLNFMIPELAIQVGHNHDSPYHQLDIWNHTIKTVALSPGEIDCRWAALLHDVGKPYARIKNSRGYSNYPYHDILGGEMVESIGKRFKWSSERIRTVKQLVTDHLSEHSPLFAADGAATKA